MRAMWLMSHNSCEIIGFNLFFEIASFTLMWVNICDTQSLYLEVSPSVFVFFSGVIDFQYAQATDVISLCVHVFYVVIVPIRCRALTYSIREHTHSLARCVSDFFFRFFLNFSYYCDNLSPTQLCVFSWRHMGFVNLQLIHLVWFVGCYVCFSCAANELGAKVRALCTNSCHCQTQWIFLRLYFSSVFFPRCLFYFCLFVSPILSAAIVPLAHTWTNEPKKKAKKTKRTKRKKKIFILAFGKILSYPRYNYILFCSVFIRCQCFCECKSRQIHARTYTIAAIA